MTSTTTEELRQQLLSAVRKSQDLTLEAIKTAVDAASRVTHKIPVPESVVSGAYGLAEKLLAEQRKFAGDVLKATAALRPSAGNTDTASPDTVSDDTVSDDTLSREPASDDATTPDSASTDTASTDTASTNSASTDSASTDSASQDTATTDTRD